MSLYTLITDNDEVMTEIYKIKGMGWLPDYPDIRDYTIERTDVKDRLSNIDNIALIARNVTNKLDERVDWSRYCSPVEDQGTLASSTAHAIIGLVEYFERLTYGKNMDASRLFLYKLTRKLLRWTGDTGAFLRTTIRALNLFGLIPEEYWKYDISDLDTELPAFCYALAQKYAVKYLRLDHDNILSVGLLHHIKSFISKRHPLAFGFSVYKSISQVTSSGFIPYPDIRGDTVVGGHAVMAVGYDDYKYDVGGGASGALLIRNSWGTDWGQDGYGWLPYEYVLDGLTKDWWTLYKEPWSVAATTLALPPNHYDQDKIS
jgi:C1A family cysteine protease